MQLVGPHYRRSLLRAGSFVHRLMRSMHGPKAPPMVMPPVPLPPPMLGAPLPAHQPKAADVSTLSRLLSSFLPPAHQPANRHVSFPHQAGLPAAAGDQQKASDVSTQKRTVAVATAHCPVSVSPYQAACSDASKSIPYAGHYAPSYVHPSRLPNLTISQHLPPPQLPQQPDASNPAASSSGGGQTAPLAVVHPTLAPNVLLPPHLPPPAHPAHAPPMLALPHATASANKWRHGPGWRAEHDVGSPPTQSQHVVFLARVLVGQSTVGCSEYRRPPPVDANRPFGRCYDTCVNRTVNPSIFVVFNSSQCYPEYIVEYTNSMHPGDFA
jgi:hypothetical protein